MWQLRRLHFSISDNSWGGSNWENLVVFELYCNIYNGYADVTEEL